jgi:arginyl-tRNA synthetase
MIKNFIYELLKNALSKLEIFDAIIIIDYPKNREYGDVSTNIAMQLAKQLRKNPREVANLIIANLEYDSSLINKVDIAGAGFINFYFSDIFFQNILINISKFGDDYGKTKAIDKKAIVEYVSANPTGLLHLGHGRNAVIGDTIANLLLWSGYDITREYYFNNAGNQMRNLAKSIYARIKQSTDQPDYDFPEDGYHGEYIKEIAAEYIKLYGNVSSDSTETIQKLQKFGEEWNFVKIKKTLENLNVFQDEYYNENSLYETGKINKLIEDFRELNLIYEKEGAIWLKFSELGLEQDRVIVKSSGEPTYRLPDIAYHREKFLRGFDLMVDIFGADHIATIPDVLAGVKSLGFDEKKVKVVIHQFVTLTENGQQVKMSKRSGKSYTLDELIEEVGRDVVRFFFLMRGVNTHLEFDLGLAQEQSEKNPVFYLQYAFARISSLFSKVQENFDYTNVNFELLNKSEELNLIKRIDDFTDVIKSSANNYEPHILSDYLRELAAEFHLFYHNNRVIGEDLEIMKARLFLLNQVKIVLKNGLTILGITAPEKM